ncbi:O-methyltransferase family protein [Heracleum sosnowskyi]|uniref:O-methyltransferase family protein n=1 Tax=Heracleum sosnowskyi TaxID=360622 RepID=A0AAD8HQ38_9APIA|nr:O-methyltransferase family protein [Heracleum sosnowskyi]
MTLSQLSSVLACSSTSLFRIMRFLMSWGIFKEKITNKGFMGYVQTPLSRLLTKDGNDSLATFLLFENNSFMLAPWHFLTASVLDNKTSPITRALGKELCSLDQCPKVFIGMSSVVNVGGGDGTTLHILIKTCPWIQGINFDLPHVVSVVPECEGIEHVGGDMFISVPEANAAFLKWILHDWSDD